MVKTTTSRNLVHSLTAFSIIVSLRPWSDLSDHQVTRRPSPKSGEAEPQGDDTDSPWHGPRGHTCVEADPWIGSLQVRARCRGPSLSATTKDRDRFRSEVQSVDCRSRFCCRYC